ncbi:MAG: hypothetical protein M3367_16320 [Acidobacteriota bacterium]|nr:hypothetical protein [Acidobacteriota bacterium]
MRHSDTDTDADTTDADADADPDGNTAAADADANPADADADPADAGCYHFQRTCDCGQCDHCGSKCRARRHGSVAPHGRLYYKVIGVR